MLRELLYLVLFVGVSSQYAPGKMQEVINVRQVPGKTAYTVPQNLSAYDGFMAMRDCNELGNEYYLRPKNSTKWEHFLVVDCSGHAETSQWMLRNNIIAEVDYASALRWNTIGKGIDIEIAQRILPGYAIE